MDERPPPLEMATGVERAEHLDTPLQVGGLGRHDTPCDAVKRGRAVHDALPFGSGGIPRRRDGGVLAWSSSLARRPIWLRAERARLCSTVERRSVSVAIRASTSAARVREPR